MPNHRVSTRAITVGDLAELRSRERMRFEDEDTAVEDAPWCACCSWPNAACGARSHARRP
jgi:hypothetical protein